MRKVTIATCAAFMADMAIGQSNTTVTVNEKETKLFLFGNLIAKKDRATGKISVTNAGYETPATKERLNGLPGVSINQADFVWYLNGKEWNGEWKEID
jgi:hypothetical protein